MRDVCPDFIVRVTTLQSKDSRRVLADVRLTHPSLLSIRQESV